MPTSDALSLWLAGTVVLVCLVAGGTEALAGSNQTNTSHGHKTLLGADGQLALQKLLVQMVEKGYINKKPTANTFNPTSTTLTSASTVNRVEIIKIREFSRCYFHILQWRMRSQWSQPAAEPNQTRLTRVGRIISNRTEENSSQLQTNHVPLPVFHWRCWRIQCSCTME